MKNYVQLLIVFCLTVFWVGSVNAEEKQPAKPANAVKSAQDHNTVKPTQDLNAAPKGKIGSLAPALKGLQWVKGGPVIFEKGKVYIVEFWATWCGPCRQSIPHLTKLQKEYKDKGVTVIGISDEDKDKVTKFLAKQGDKMDYTIAIDADGKANEDYMKAFQQEGIPTAFIINGEGVIVWNGHPLNDMDVVLAKVLKGGFDYIAYAKQKEEEAKIMKKLEAMTEGYYATLSTQGNTESAKKALREITKQAPAGLLNEIAWTLLTEIKKENRDLPGILDAAKKAADLTEHKEANILDTYALALFENGKVEEAIVIQQKVVEMTKDTPEINKELTERLDKYKAALSKTQSAKPQ